MREFILTSARPTALCSILALSVLTACSGRPAATETRAASQTSASAPAARETPAVTPAAPPGGQTITATVLETMDASSYTYVRVKVDSRELWAAASQFKVAVGDKVVLSLEQPLEHFHSQSLNRDFPLIYFVSRIGHEGDAAPPPMAVGHPPLQGPATSAPRETTVVEPAKDGTTVAAVWATRTALAGNKVTVRGKVVKFNGGILGVNWIHLQDGTGKAADGSNDITVTATTDVRVGDVITVTGTVAVNKDLGSGYNYPVIIEHASVLQK